MTAVKAITNLTGRRRAAIGCLLGTAVGDALGLPCEGLSRSRQLRMFPRLDQYRFLLGKGMCSDDTDHACMVAQALAYSEGNPRRFLASLGWRLRFWLLGLPAGIGFATLRSIVKLWLAFPPQFSGVHSAGNGPAMRSALLGVCLADDDAALIQHVAASTAITHRDARAECGALAVALAARASMRGDAPARYLAELRKFLAPFGTAGKELLALAERAATSAERAESTATFADSIGCARGVSGYMYHSVPVALHAWFSSPHDFASAITGAIRCGGDTDTVGAIAGAIVGAGVGKEGIPPQWLADLWDWPRGVRWIERLAERAAIGAPRPGEGATFIAPWWILARNLGFLLIVLAHGFRRLAPPY
jgi:ADP-ribosyl-[dinitrogen reductase] hydrolase